MKNFDTTKIMNNYTEAERKEIIFATMMMQNTGAPAPQNEEEFKDFCEKVINERKKAERKEAERKERKAKREAEEAEAKGMTIEEYKEYKKEEAKIKRYQTEIKKMEAEIKEIQRKINYRKNYIAKNKG